MSLSVTDILNRPPAIAEDTLKYTLYPSPISSDKASVSSLAACILEFISSTLTDFLWHRDGFELKAVLDSDHKSWILSGIMRVGDSVDDEWCVVWLLRQISHRWDVAICVYDSDGEFLLIEAAEVLPSWVSPSNSENRVWIYKSTVHLIPITFTSQISKRRHRRKLPGARESDDEDNGIGLEQNDTYLAVDDALNHLRDSNVITEASEELNNAIWSRVSGYPDALKKHIHKAKAYVPIDIVKALQWRPELIQKAVETFYTRDGIQLRAAYRMSRFPPGSSVLTTVKMTRPAYAQLIGQRFSPPKVFGRWKEQEGSPDWRWRDIGMKIAVGFEMLYQEGKSAGDITNTSPEGIKSSADATRDALLRNADYQDYLKNLISLDYFRGEVEGSQLWSSLEHKAMNIFLEVRKEDDMNRPSFASLVSSAIAQTSNQPVSPVEEEDDDSWLNVDPDQLDLVLGEGTESSKHDANEELMQDSNEKYLKNGPIEDQATRLRSLADKVQDFVEGEGGMEGAMFKDEEFSDEEFSDYDMDADSDDESQDAQARQEALDNLVPGLEPDEYGRMPPSYHANSQRTAVTTVETDKVGPGPSTATTRRSQEKHIREPILPRDKFDGVDSDDETDEERDQDSEDEEDHPQVVGDIEVDMTEEEDEFLEFSRQALGISDEQWQGILQDRRERGEYAPKFTPSSKPTSQANMPDIKSSLSPSNAVPTAQTNKLDSFEAVMKAMDEELARNRTQSRQAPLGSKNAQGKGKVVDTEEDGDIETAMDAELKAALEGGSDEELEEEPVDYAMIRNFLESFKSQAGLSGPVSNLAGRLQPGWNLPRDEDD